jgi:hypothetical protein
MISKEELLRWGNTLEDGKYVAIDEGGLALVELHADGHQRFDDAYLEVGGIPLLKEDSDENTSTYDQTMAMLGTAFKPIPTDIEFSRMTLVPVNSGNHA